VGGGELRGRGEGGERAEEERLGRTNGIGVDNGKRVG
jgi:hypothetical protein